MFYPIDKIPDLDAWKIPIGKAFPNFEVFALDDAGNVISRCGETGELYVSASTVALGYWNDEERTREKFTSDPRRPLCDARVYRTGDIVRLDEHGDFVFAGRKDHMVKSRGYRIELDEIELVLNSHPAVQRAAVIAVPDDLLGNRIIAMVTMIEGNRFEKDSLIDFCAKRLPRYMLPETIQPLDSLPVTSSGKIDRKSLQNSCSSEKVTRPVS